MRRVVLVFVLCALPFLVAARATPETMPLGTATALADLMAAARSSVSIEVRGNGDRLVLSYTSAGPVDLFIFPVLEDGSPAVDSALVARLPEGLDAEVDLDLAASPAWSPGERPYRVHALSRESVRPTIHDAVVGRGSQWLPVIALRQLGRSEPYEPSTYHRLQGYGFFGWHAGPVFAVLLMAAAALLWVAGRQKAAPILLLLGFLFYGARVSVDLTRISFSHLRDWGQDGTYAQAGAITLIAEAVRAETAQLAGASVFVCHDGSSYLPTLLRYFLYPIPVTDSPISATFVLVAGKVRRGEGPDVLQCGDASIPARRIRSFPDGSVLFRVLSS